MTLALTSALHSNKITSILSFRIAQKKKKTLCKSSRQLRGFFFLAPVHGNRSVHPNPKRRMYRHLLQVPLGRPKDLLSREYLRSTLQIWVLWFGVAFTYYGMVLASAEVLRLRNAESKSIQGLIRYLLTIIMQPVEMSQSFHFFKL